MVLDRDQLRWNGWGWKHESFEMSETRREALVQTLSARLGVTLTPSSCPPRVSPKAPARRSNTPSAKSA